jgi:aromatic ring-opening dioxygenase LigB subunit
LSYACIAPHGGELIPNLATETSLRTFQKTREGMIKLAKETAMAKPATIVVATPHGLRLWKNIGVVTAQNSSGRLQASSTGKTCVNLRVKCDREFANELRDKAKKNGLPVVGANYGSTEGSASDMPMDWGTLVPLWFILKSCRRKPSVVIVTPSREIPLRRNYEFGRIVAELAESDSKRIVFVASADQAHAHKKTGPYGFSKAASEYDQFVSGAIRRNRIEAIMSLPGKFVEDARPDSLWQIAMLAGALSRIGMRAELFSYQVPTYYGMICAGFRRR